jgi:hypothetical protein
VFFSFLPCVAAAWRRSSPECICAAVYIDIGMGLGPSPSRSRRRAVDISHEKIPPKQLHAHENRGTTRLLSYAPASAVYVFVSNNSWFVRIRSERPDVTVWLLRYKKLERTLQRAAAYFYGCTRPYIFTCMFSFWASLSKPTVHVHMNASRESVIRTCHSASW